MSVYPKIENLYHREPTGARRLLFDRLKNPAWEYVKLWHFEEKLDGMNVRLDVSSEEWRLRGRTDNAVIPAGLATWFAEWRRRVDIKPQNICIYGEAIGPKINGNPHGRKSVGVRIFDAQRIDAFGGGLNRWISREALPVLARDLGLMRSPTFPLLAPLTSAITIVRDGWGTDDYFEGIVARPPLEMFDCNGERIIFKLKRKDLP